MNKHTTGPWRYVRENGSPTTGQHMIAGIVPGYLAEVRDCGRGEVEANARLIAAAPDLLNALVAIMDMRDKCFIPNEGNWWDDMANSAIAKARGEP